MSEADAVAGVLLLGATMYAVFGGADFGAGLWSLFAGGGTDGRRRRALIDWAIGPVWEANHVWLIFTLVVLWTGFPTAFESIFSTLFIPLSLAALGIVLRGAGFAFQHTARRARGRALAVWFFGLASVLTPFFMGTVVGAIAGERVPVGNDAGDLVTSWLNPLSIVLGVLFVATGAYLSAVFLVSEARRAGTPDLERYFVNRALGAALAAGALAVVGLIALHEDARFVFDGLKGDALPLAIVSVAGGLAVLVLLRRGVQRGTRVLAVVAVAAVIWAWGVAQHPYLLPQVLTIGAAAAPSTTLTGVLIVFGIAVVVVLPALGLLFTLVQRNLVEETERPTYDGGTAGTGHSAS
jgi:cytochrome bd ubiquinol oxidase subunit II